MLPSALCPSPAHRYRRAKPSDARDSTVPHTAIFAPASCVHTIRGRFWKIVRHSEKRREVSGTASRTEWGSQREFEIPFRTMVCHSKKHREVSGSACRTERVHHRVGVVHDRHGAGEHHEHGTGEDGEVLAPHDPGQVPVVVREWHLGSAATPGPNRVRSSPKLAPPVFGSVAKASGKSVQKCSSPLQPSQCVPTYPLDQGTPHSVQTGRPRPSRPHLVP